LKPDPRIFRAALDRLGVHAHDAVIVGDKIRTDILGGAILGMRSILVEERLRRSVENGQTYVDAIIPRLQDIFETETFRRSVGH
jgi:FMN phosphatase YigB (HAD superfamily)